MIPVIRMWWKPLLFIGMLTAPGVWDELLPHTRNYPLYLLVFLAGLLLINQLRPAVKRQRELTALVDEILRLTPPIEIEPRKEAE